MKPFSVPPTEKVILEAVQSLGFNDLSDIRCVDSSMINPTLMEQVKDALRVHYFPCVAKMYLDKPDFTYVDYITIVRQLLRQRGMKLIRREGCEKVDKATYRYFAKYQLQPPAAPAQITVDFS